MCKYNSAINSVSVRHTPCVRRTWSRTVPVGGLKEWDGKPLVEGKDLGRQGGYKMTVILTWEGFL